MTYLGRASHIDIAPSSGLLQLVAPAQSPGGQSEACHHSRSSCADRWWARRKRAFAHPHMRAFESSVLTEGLVWFFAFGVAAARGAMRSAACRRGRCAQGLASSDLCSVSLHHLISGRTVVRTHIPHTCGEEAMMMGPIYETACLLAQGWHGHHRSRADRGRCRDADALLGTFTPSQP
jgi:hypothetical protein